MNAAQLRAGLERAGGNQRGDRQRRPPLFPGGVVQLGEEFGQALLARYQPGVLPQQFHGVAHIGYGRGRYVYGVGSLADGPVQRRQQVVDGGDVGVVRQDPGSPEFLDEGVEVDAGAAGDVGCRGQEPQGRKSHGEDAEGLHEVARHLALDKLLARDVLHGEPPADSADGLDGDSQGAGDEALVNLCVAHRRGQDVVRGFQQQPAAAGRRGADQPLRQRDHVTRQRLPAIPLVLRDFSRLFGCIRHNPVLPC